MPRKKNVGIRGVATGGRSTPGTEQKRWKKRFKPKRWENLIKRASPGLRAKKVGIFHVYLEKNR